VGKILFSLYDTLCLSLRVKVIGEVFVVGRPTLFFFWHRNLIPLPHIFRNSPIKVMVSPSGDGQLIGEVVRRKGLEVIWSSQYKSPLRGVVEAMRALRGGWNVAITPDGPRGPKLHFKRGTFELMRRANVRTVFVGVAFSSSYHLPSWDEMRVPMPFSAIAVLVEEAYPSSPEEASEILKDLDDRAFHYLDV